MMDLEKMISDPFYNAYQIAALRWGKDNAALAERIYELETGHYKSEQFKNGYSAGMVAFSNTYPYGWDTLKDFWDKHPYLKPVGLWNTTVNGKAYSYLKFPTFRAALMALCVRLEQDGWDANKWNGDTTGQYAQMVDKVSNQYVV